MKHHTSVNWVVDWRTTRPPAFETQFIWPQLSFKATQQTAVKYVDSRLRSTGLSRARSDLARNTGDVSHPLRGRLKAAVPVVISQARR